MTTNSFRALLVATAAAAILAVSGARAADAPAPKLNAAVGKALNAAQKANQTQDWTAMKAALDDADKVSGRSDYDNYVIAQFIMVLDANTKDMAGATTAAQTRADYAAQPATEKPNNLKLATQLSLQAKQFDKALVYAKALEALNVTDSVSQQAITQSYYYANDFTNAAARGMKIIDTEVAAGQKPDRNTLDLVLNSQVKAKDEAGAEKTLELMVATYNDPNDWQQMIDVTFGTKGLRDVDAVWLGRLLFLSGATVSAQDATLIGSTASHLTFFGDAQVAQQHGATGFPDANAAANKDKATMAAQIAAGQKANGQYNVKMAEALYSYGMYPEAEAAARLGISKGGATDPSEGPMVLGQALVAEGKYDEGIAALNQVAGGGPATPRIVRLWVDYANIKKNPPTAAPAAAAAK